MILDEEGLQVEGSQIEVLTSLFVVATMTLEQSGIDRFTADELGQRIVARVHDRWQAMGLVVRHPDPVDEVGPGPYRPPESEQEAFGR